MYSPGWGMDNHRRRRRRHQLHRSLPVQGSKGSFISRASQNKSKIPHVFLTQAEAMQGPFRKTVEQSPPRLSGLYRGISQGHPQSDLSPSDATKSPDTIIVPTVIGSKDARSRFFVWGGSRQPDSQQNTKRRGLKKCVSLQYDAPRSWRFCEDLFPTKNKKKYRQDNSL